MNRIWFILVASLLLLSCNKQTPEKEVLPRTQKERVRWFEEARLGIMIHWSLCTPAAGRFYGEKVRNSEYAEWIRCHNKVQKADWDKMAKRMTDIVLPDYPFDCYQRGRIQVSYFCDKTS